MVTSAEIQDTLLNLNEGDNITVSKDGTSISGPVQIRNREHYIQFGQDKIDIWRSLRMGYTLEVTSHAAHVVPNEPGLYASKYSEEFSVQYFLLWRDRYGDLLWSGVGGAAPISHRELPYDYLPLRLVELAPEE